MRVSLALRHQGPGSTPLGLPHGAVRDSLCWPYAVAACAGGLAIADTGNNRVLLWDVAP